MSMLLITHSNFFLSISNFNFRNDPLPPKTALNLDIYENIKESKLPYHVLTVNKIYLGLDKRLKKKVLIY